VSPDIAASVKARLLSQSKESGEEFELFLVRFVGERFLYRLGASDLRGRCILKGAGLLTLWMNDPYRATRDIDLLAYGPNDEACVRAAMETVCRIPCPEDGLVFDLDNLIVSPIRDDAEYTGQRAVLQAYLGNARIRLQVDFGFGDVIPSPGPEEAVYPTLVSGLPAPRLRTYPRPVSVAEKLEAMVRFGRSNSRMKDFHDIWALARQFPFEGERLREAVSMCFERRGTAWTTDLPESLQAAFYGRPELQVRWRAYLRNRGLRPPPPGNFEEIGEGIRGFVLPVRDSIAADARLEMYWPAGGPWQAGGLKKKETNVGDA
jgi:hypothetical protein